MRTAAVAASIGLLGGLGCGGSKPRPNILLYVVDTLRADSLEPYGNRVVATPAVSRLAREGVLYETVYAHSSWTRPSITSILTGALPSAHRVEGRSDSAPPSLRLISEALSEVGYTTGAIVTNPNVGSFFGFDQGYESFVELFTSRGETVVQSSSPRARSDTVTDRAIEWIDGAKKPFFLFLLTTDPHGPYEPPPGFDHFDARSDPTPKGPRYKPRYRPMIEDGFRPWRYAEADRSKYYGEVAFNDASFGRLLDHLRETGLYDETWIVFCSDHGEEFGEHGHRKHGRTLFEEQVRVPLVIRRPGEPEPGRRVATPVQLVDIHPTLLAAAGLSPPDDLPGIVLPQAAAGARPIYARLALDGYSSEMVVAPPWKWIASHAQPTLDRRELGGLFQLEDDPFEATDLQAKRPDLVAQLRGALSDRGPGGKRERGPGDADRELPTEVREALEVLGYLEPQDARPRDDRAEGATSPRAAE